MTIWSDPVVRLSKFRLYLHELKVAPSWNEDIKGMHMSVKMAPHIVSQGVVEKEILKSFLK